MVNSCSRPTATITLTASNTSKNTALESFDKNYDASTAHDVWVTKDSRPKSSWTLPLDEEAKDNDERSFTHTRVYHVDCDRTVPMNEHHQLYVGMDAAVKNEKHATSICHEIDHISPLVLASKRRMALLKKQRSPAQLCLGMDDAVTSEEGMPSIDIDDISPLALASKRRMALLKRQRSPSQQREGIILIILRIVIATICSTCVEPLTTIRRQQSYIPSTDSCRTEPVYELFDNHEQNMLQIYFRAVISKIYLMILKPIYSSINPRKRG